MDDGGGECSHVRLPAVIDDVCLTLTVIDSMKMNLFAFSRKKVFTLTAALFSFWVIFLIASIWFGT